MARIKKNKNLIKLQLEGCRSFLKELRDFERDVYLECMNEELDSMKNNEFDIVVEDGKVTILDKTKGEEETTIVREQTQVDVESEIIVEEEHEEETTKIQEETQIEAESEVIEREEVLEETPVESELEVIVEEERVVQAREQVEIPDIVVEKADIIVEEEEEVEIQDLAVVEKENVQVVEVIEEDEVEEDEVLRNKRLAKKRMSSFEYCDAPVKRAKKKVKEDEKLRQLKIVLQNRTWNYEIDETIQTKNQVSYGLHEVEKIKKQPEENQRIKSLVEIYDKYRGNERKLKGLKLFVCLGLYRMFKSKNITKADYLAPFMVTPKIHQSLKTMLSLGMKLDTISSWLDVEVDIWRLEEVLDINYATTTLTQIEKIFKK